MKKNFRLVEINGFLYALDTESNRLGFWDKNVSPDSVGSGAQTTIDLPSAPGVEDQFDDIDGDLGTDGERIYVRCSLEGVNQGIAVFWHDPEFNELVFLELIPDPVTNEYLTPGPRLGGLDLHEGNLFLSDRNGPVIQYYDPTLDEVKALKLQNGFTVQRLSIRAQQQPGN